MTLSLNIGSPGSIALVQKGSGAVGPQLGPVITLTLPAPSTAGSALVAVLGGQSAAMVATFPTGWALQGSAVTGTTLIQTWIYPNNPGGISTVNVAISAGVGTAHLSEWANVGAIAVLEASGTATATSGTTLAPTTSTNVLTVGDLAISAWLQVEASGNVTFTTPAGFTRLVDTGANGLTGHLDVEYKINPATGATLGPTLTSTGTTVSAAGAIVVLKPIPPVADQSAYLLYGSVSVKLNTLDLVLVDCPTPIQVLTAVTLSDPGNYPDWTGTISQVQARDVVDIRSGHHFQVITATNTQTPNFTGAPFNLSDNPAANTTDSWLLENGDTWELENGTGSWLMESSVQEDSYQGLSIGSQVGATSPAITLTTLGYVTVFRVGLWVGMTFRLTSSNLANWITAPGSLYTIASITITYQGANPPKPVYAIQFGDQILTLADWVRSR